MKASHGTTIPHDMRLRVLNRDAAAVGGCVGFALFPVGCSGPLELDHVRASHGMGMKSVTCDCNLVALCGNCHRYKTAYGRSVRPLLLKYLDRFGYSQHEEDHLLTEAGARVMDGNR
jgi:5-methylcytosine-specific restriction endonuclease McrA